MQRFGLDAAHLGVPTNAARHTASGPILPLIELAVGRVWLLTARTGVLQNCRARSTTILRLLDDVALPKRLTGLRFARCPLVPRADFTINDCVLALGLRVFSFPGDHLRTVTRITALVVRHLEGPRTHLDARTAAVVNPVAPSAELAILRDALVARVKITSPELLVIALTLLTSLHL
jgi:hypothetical protein